MASMLRTIINEQNTSMIRNINDARNMNAKTMPKR